MADRTSARLLGRVFKMMAEKGELTLAFKLFMQEVPMGDFSAYQMEVDDELVLLGLARAMTLEECERECVNEGVIYIHEKNF